MASSNPQGKLQASVLLLLSLLVFSFPGHAQTHPATETSAYITDRIKVHLRTGKGIRYKILRRLNSGTPVTVLEHDPDSGYSRVRLRDGTKGWVLTRYLSDKPSARVQLGDVTQKLQQLTEENARLLQELESLKAQHGSLASEKTALTSRTAELTAEIQRIRNAAANALSIEDERNHLRERVASLERELHQSQLENQALSSDNSRHWFLIGAGVLAGGILLGLILPHLRWRRRHDWNSL